MREMEDSNTMTTSPDQQNSQLLHQQFTKLLRFSSDLEARAEITLAEYSKEMAPEDNDLVALENERLTDKKPPREFCYGAKLFQIGEKNDEDLEKLATAASSKSGWGYICKFCKLEVGYYPAIRLTSDGKALESSKLLTASHLVACKSLLDHRAFYRCLACYMQHKIVEFPSALAFEKHMERHIGFTILQKSEEDRLTKRLQSKEDELMSSAELSTYEVVETNTTPVAVRHEPVIQQPKPQRPQPTVQNADSRSEVSSLEEDYKSVDFSADEPEVSKTKPRPLNDFQELPPIGSRSREETLFRTSPNDYVIGAVEGDSVSISEHASFAPATDIVELPTEEGTSNSIRGGKQRVSQDSDNFVPERIPDSEIFELPLEFMARPSDSRREVMSPEPVNPIQRVSTPFPRNYMTDHKTNPEVREYLPQTPTKSPPKIPPKSVRSSSSSPLIPDVRTHKPTNPPPNISRKAVATGSGSSKGADANPKKLSKPVHSTEDEIAKSSRPKSSSSSGPGKMETEKQSGRILEEGWVLEDKVYRLYRGGQVVREQEGFPVGNAWVFSEVGWKGSGTATWCSFNAESKKFVFK